ncbi:MAG: AAA family ATPase [Rickettsiales bacterium]|jgi:DNA polymerase-3 subunit delta'|nr:AAA family ATPase [Rickettsiales bacterium]
MAIKKKESSFDFPKSIDNRDLIGHSATASAFLDAWKKRDEYPIHPVWLLTGPRGIGKATLAYNLTRRIFSDLTGREIDEIAEQMSAGGIGDLFIIDLDHNITRDSKPLKSITIETIRGMIEKMRMSSMAESWRVAIVDSLDELSRDTPNTLLKTLEEPPKKTIFFLIAHSLDRVLPTIRSRARVEKLRPLSSMELREIANRLLPGKEIDDDLIKISGGSFGRIANMVASGADGFFNETIRILSDVMANSSDYLLLAKKIAAAPENISILADVAAHFGLAELYPSVVRDIARMNDVHLDPETSAYKIIVGIKKCL